MCRQRVALTDDGVLFGNTVLGTADVHTRLSRLARHGTNSRGIFDNRSDGIEMFNSILERSFQNQTVEVVGSVAI